MRFAQVSYGSVDSDAPASSAWRLSTAHDAVKLFSFVPNERKWLQRFVRPKCHKNLSPPSPLLPLLFRDQCNNTPNSERNQNERNAVTDNHDDCRPECESALT